MRISILLLSFPALAFAVPATIPATELRNNNATIWAQSAVLAMKAGANRIYQASVDVYNQRNIFDQPHAPCKSPPDQGQSGNTLCTRADKLTSTLNNVIEEELLKIAKAMFPVYYGLPDNADEPRATFSDFSHFYNYLFIQMIYTANLTQYYACKGFFGYQSATYNSSYIVWPDAMTEGIIFSGPDDRYNETTQTMTGNGTGEYYVDPNRPHYYPHFYYSWQINYSNFLSTFWTSYNIMFNRSGYAPKLCPQVEAGLKPPTAPGKTMN